MAVIIDCSTTTPEWLDRLARRLSDQEREWMETRMRNIAATPSLLVSRAHQAEYWRLADELRTGYRASASAVVR